MSKNNEEIILCQKCQKVEYEIGVHRISDGKNIDYYYCEECWHEVKYNRKMKKKDCID